MSINQIVEGTLNNIFNKKEDLYLQRIQICRNCKLLTVDRILGEICNPMLYIDPKTDKTSSFKQNGYIKGCGCILKSKCRVDNAKCPANKW